MSRKSIILCLTVLAVLLSGLGVAVAVLYSDTASSSGKVASASSFGSRDCLSAVPSDAVLVSYFDNVGTACKGILSALSFPSCMAEMIEDGSLASLKRCSMAVSLHYVGKLHSLYIIDVERASDDAVEALKGLADREMMFYTRAGDYLVLSGSETLVRSASRHFEKNVSIADAPGFCDAVMAAGGKDILLISNLHAQKLMQSLFAGKVSRNSSFVERFADWMAFNLTSGNGSALSLDGVMLHEGDSDEFMTVFDRCTPADSEVAEILPDYTSSAVSFTVKNIDEYISSYQSFIDSRQGLQNFKQKQAQLKKVVGIHPESFFELLEVKELASASFMVRSKMEKVNLIRTGCKDAALIFKGNDINSFRDCSSQVYGWAYPSFVASVFGKYFALEDESCFTYIDGWIITGSRAAIEEYATGKAVEYTLAEYMSDAGQPSLLSGNQSLFTAYFSMTGNRERLSSFMKPELSDVVSDMIEDCDYSPLVFSINRDKKTLSTSLDIHKLTIRKSKAPSFDRDTVVIVPNGPFEVKNSHTGKVNKFYQNASKAICLRDETGKDLWGVPLGKSICGTAHNVDYFANGKLQVIFGAGSSVYVIDRLGRYVSGFPLDLGKEIVLGPDVYDFTGARKYNIMVLHRDNTVQMYNLKGKKPEAWKGITAEETIKGLPERLSLGGKDFWVVRTSIQTLIYPFYGGEPLTALDGNAKIKPDSVIEAVDASSIQALCYDGKKRTIRLK